MLQPFPRPILAALAGSTPFFLEALDSTIIAPALSDMARSFGTTPVALSQGISAYLVTVAIFVPASGWLADRIGARRTICSAMVVFIFASVLCGLSQTLEQFTAARVLQGIGGALMSPVARLEVLRRSDKKQLLRNMALVTWPGLTAMVIGPPLGGFVAGTLSWPYVFFINIPLGLLSFTAIMVMFNDDYRAPRPFDYIGFVLLGLAMALVMFGLELLGRHHGSSTLAIGFLIGGLVFGTAAVLHSRRSLHPLLDFSVVRIQTFGIAVVSAGTFLRLNFGATSFLATLFVQIIFGFNAIQTGLMMFAYALGDILIKPATQPIIRRFGFRRVLIFNGSLIALSALLFMFITRETPYPVLALLLAFAGATRSFQFTATNGLSYADIPATEMSNASAVSATMLQVTFGGGIALAAMLLALFSGLGERAADRLTVGDFHAAFGVLMVLALIAVAYYFRLPAHAGSAVSGRVTAQK